MYMMLCLICGAVGGVTLGALASGAGRTVNTALGLLGGLGAYGVLTLLSTGGTLSGAVDMGVTLTQAGAGFVGGALLSGGIGRFRQSRPD